MENDPKYNDVLQLLKKLKDTNGAYPQELLAIRRQGYLKQVAEVAGGAGLAFGLRNTVRNVRTAGGIPPIAGTILEGLLVFAIVAEAGTLTYFHREKLVEFFQKLTNEPRVEEGANPPVFNSLSPEPTTLQVTLTPGPIRNVTLTITQTPVFTATSTLELAGQPTISTTGQEGGQGQAGSTPAPNNGDDSNGNNGNHYGQTPRPERTKDPGNTN